MIELVHRLETLMVILALVGEGVFIFLMLVAINWLWESMKLMRVKLDLVEKIKKGEFNNVFSATRA